jgi:hydroxymethylbilane synthase
MSALFSQGFFLALINISMNKKLTIASRESRLAMWQANHIKNLLEQNGFEVDIIGMTTEGDRRLDVTLNEIGGKGLFIKELEQALLDGRADLAVHSMKDVPMEMGEDFRIVAITEREDVRDAFVSNNFENLESLPDGARVGTSSLRRQAQILKKFPKLQILPLRGNLDTRLRKLDDNEYDAIILAAAGLKRLGLENRIRSLIDPTTIITSPGQGALGIEILRNRNDLVEALGTLTHIETTVSVMAERAFSRRLGGSCRLPIAAYAQTSSNQMFSMSVMLSMPDGTKMITAKCSGPWRKLDELATQTAEAILKRGGNKILEQLTGNQLQ